MQEFYQRLILTRLSMNMTKKEFGELGGVSDVSQGRYEEENSDKRQKPGMDYFLNLQENNVDIYYLLTGKKTESELNTEESLLLETFRSGNDQSKKLIMDLCRTLSGIPTPQSSATNINSDTHSNVNTGGGDYMPKGKKKS